MRTKLANQIVVSDRVFFQPEGAFERTTTIVSVEPDASGYRLVGKDLSGITLTSRPYAAGEAVPLVQPAVLWDYDDSAVYGWFDAATRHLQGQPRPDVARVMTQLTLWNVEQAILTNQAGLLYGAAQDEIMRFDPNWVRKNYPTPHVLADRITESMQLLGLSRIYVSIWDERARLMLISATSSYNLPSIIDVALKVASDFQSLLRQRGLNAHVSADHRWRKPGTGMFEQCFLDLGISQSQRVLCDYVGDMETDQEAAEAFGMGYVHADNVVSLIA